MSDTGSYYSAQKVELVPEEQGEHIAELQGRLIAVGFSDVQTTGRFDDATEAALSSYASNRNLDVNSNSLGDAVVHLATETGPMQTAEWVQRFTIADPMVYGHSANLQKEYVGESIPGNEKWKGKARSVTYYPDEETAAVDYGYEIEGGRFVDLDTTGVTSSAGWTGSKPERMIYTMDDQGDFRLADPRAEQVAHPGERVHHSTLVHGEAVSGSGEMKVRDGVVEAVSDKSGHYRPDFAMTQQVGRALNDQGVDTKRVTFELGNDDPVTGAATTDTLMSGRGGPGVRPGRDPGRPVAPSGGEGRGRAQEAFGERSWNFIPEEARQRQIETRQAELYEAFAAMDERTLRDEARKIIEERHVAKNAVLKDLPARNEARWMDDPSGRHQYRFFDGTQWTDDVSDKDVQSKDEYSG